MTGDSLSTPVLFLVFKRPGTTRRVFEGIRKARPARLFVAADGPRDGWTEEAELCRETREVIRVDWECDLRTLFRDRNLGVKAGVASSIDWFFENAGEGIILEDDCLPHPDFFTFAAGLLARYRDDPRLMHVSGDNFQLGRRRGEASYYFSRYAHCWGWATWRRAWALYDVEMGGFPGFASRREIDKIIGNRRVRNYWMKVFGDAHSGRYKTWDYAWAYEVLARGGLCAVPNVNLVTNIGFGEGATHTFEPVSRMSGIPTESLGPLVHPAAVAVDEEADNFEFRHLLQPLLRGRLFDRLGRRLKVQK
jgi:hypothetical protein